MTLAVLIWGIEVKASDKIEFRQRQNNAAKNAADNGDFATALSIWQRLAEQGDPYAQSMLGAMYGGGRGVPEDHKTAATWYNRAAKQGDVASQIYLALYYALGKGVPKNYLHAYMWTEIALHNVRELGGDGTVVTRIISPRRLAEEMSPEQVDIATRFARICILSDYEECSFGF